MNFDCNNGPFEYVYAGKVQHKNITCTFDGDYVLINTNDGKRITTVYSNTGSTIRNEKEMHRYCVRKMTILADLDDKTLADKLRQLDTELNEIRDILVERDYRFFDAEGEELEFQRAHRICRYETNIKDI